MEQSLVQIQLNDIIEINAPTNITLNKKQFVVIYASEVHIKLLQIDTMEEINLFINEEGKLMDTSVINISLLSRDISPSYAVQNNLVPNTWIDITFSGDRPSIITGVITNLEEDMIEIKLYPSNKVIYIDFSYKGLPEELPIKEIIIRGEPKEVKLDIESKLSLGDIDKKNQDELTPKEDDIVQKELQEDIEKLDTITGEQTQEQEQEQEQEADVDIINMNDFIIEADAISFGEELGEIELEVTVDESRKRFGIDTQAADLIDDMLSSIPTNERTPEVLKNIHLQINRFVQLRNIFSVFDENGNANMPKYKGIENKPLANKLQNLNTFIRWVIPVVKNKRKLYDIELFESLPNKEDMDVAHSKLGDINLMENQYVTENGDAKPSSFNNENDRHKLFLRQLNNLYTPFELPNNVDSVLNIQKTNANIQAVLNNQENFESFSINNKIFEKTKYITQTYNLGITNIRKDNLKKNHKVTIIENDTMAITSFLMMPEKVMKYSKAYLPGVNILKKISINMTPFYYFKYLNKRTIPNTILIDNFEIPTRYDKIKFLSSITEFVLNNDIDDPEKYNKFINSIVPRIKNLFLYSKSFLNNELTITSIIDELESFHIYSDDITYMQYNEMAKHIKLEIIEYKKKFVQKSKEYKVLIPPSEPLKINPMVSLLHNVTHPVNDAQLDSFVFETTYKSSLTSSTSLLYNNLLVDNNKLITSAIAFSSLSLIGMIDIETEFKGLEKQFEDTIKDENDKNDCGTFVLSKKYLDYDEMMDDNSKTIYFDKKYDNTVYDIIDNYKREKQSMSREEFTLFLVDELKNNIGLSADKAIEDAEAMILGKRPVKEGNYAMLSFDNDDEDADVSFYRRVNNKWEKDETMKSIYTENQQAFCNVKADCFQVNKTSVCSSTNLAESEIKKNAIKYILAEFDKKMELTIEQLKSKLIGDLEYNEKIIGIIKKQRQFKLLKYNNYKFSMGMQSIEVTELVSPYEKLKNLILGHNDFVEKQNYIILFCKLFTRESIHGENMYWLYCKETNIKLIPTFILKIASSYIVGNYIETVAEICKIQGTISDDESWWVDRHSGHVIKAIEFSTDEGFDETGYAIKTGDILIEKDIYFKPNSNKETVLIDPMIEIINNIITSVSRNMKVFIEGYRKMIESMVMALLPKIINEEIYSKLEKAATKKQKKIASYEQFVNKSLVILTLALIHISIQVSIPPVNTRHTFPRCIRSFSGYPLDGDGLQSGIEYIACVAKEMSSSIPPWNSIKKLKNNIIAKDIRVYIDKHIIMLPNIIAKFDEKRLYMSLPENSKIPKELHIANWTTFLPPLIPIVAPTVDTISKSFQIKLLDNMKNGIPEQNDQIMALYSKATMLTMEIVKYINKIVKDSTPILTNKLLEPFLENSCCNNGTTNTYNYFINENPSINDNNNHIQYIESLLFDYRNFYNAPLIIDYRNTRNIITNFNSYDEEFIYNTIIHFTNLNNDQPIPNELLTFITEKPIGFKLFRSLSEKIDELKKIGKNYNEESLKQLLSIVFKFNQIDIPLPLYTNNFDRLADIISSVRTQNVSENFPIIFFDHLENVLSLQNSYLYEDPKQLEEFKFYLYNSTVNMHEDIKQFLSKHSKTTKKIQTSILNFLNTIDIWKPTNLKKKDDDGDVYRILDFITEVCNKLINVFPEIIKHKNKRDNVKIHNHWNLSDIHKNIIINFIKNYYKKLNKYMDNQTLIDMFDSIYDKVSIWFIVLKEIQCISGFYNSTPGIDLNYKYTVFNKNTCILINKYILYVMITELFNLSNKTMFQFKRGETALTSLITTDVTLDSEELKLDEVDFLPTSIDSNKNVIANFVIDACLILKQTKDKFLNFSHQDIIDKVNKEKEKEKEFEFTERLANMDDDEREVNNLKKSHKLGEWGKGLQKGLTQYVQDTFDQETRTREERMISEQKLKSREEVVDQNINIFAIEFEEQEANELLIEEDVFKLTDIPEDDDNGDNDYTDWDGGK